MIATMDTQWNIIVNIDMDTPQSDTQTKITLPGEYVMQSNSRSPMAMMGSQPSTLRSDLTLFRGLIG